MSFLSSVKDKLSRKKSSRSEKGSGSFRGSSSFRGNPFDNPFDNPFGDASSSIDADGKTTSQPGDLPPAYTPTAEPIVAADDDEYIKLEQFDTVFLIDDSGSMQGKKWEETANAMKVVARHCIKYDDDGIDIYFLNHKSANRDKKRAHGGYYGIRSNEDVAACFNLVKPRNGTLTGARLMYILEPYMLRLEAAERMTEIKKLNLIVITDGEAFDEPKLIIKDTAERLDKLRAPYDQVGIQFYQIGNDKKATKQLEEMDNMADSSNFRDMVDTEAYNPQRGNYGTIDGEQLLKVCLGAVDRKLDRKNKRRVG